MKNLVISILLSIVISNLPVWEIGQPLIIAICLFIPCSGFVWWVDELSEKIRRTVRLNRWIRELNRKGVKLNVH